ncbi:phosphoribosylanthranilate isomerase [Dyadobacter luteus]|jgi:phosphoribosylanthranilate isomerase|uniref:N-(5'-phosphoribosyl)anthranilate isomerase n=1 Tax=Dyadobacter luteus TaxID=2259619 RepID=A0A3D8Y476_9BACT|nr:phosphoribosylanthranilate isomerase [Dyadobacter luteus]REA56023.1 phosphoribosylanthranilate isomerase [Dyadobacter luteus]
MKIKVCGMRQQGNIEELVALKPNFIGFIFFEKSPRFAGEELNEEYIKAIPNDIKKVGVFVNANPGYILDTVKKYDLQYAQLHGNEMPDMCRSLRQKGVNIIKAFSIDESFNFAMLNNYKSFCDLFLFDTKGDQPGGNGKTFDWNLLKKYDNEKPFFLSGGIGPDNLEEVIQLSKSMPIYGIDVNSKYETEPGIKDISKLTALFASVRVKEEEEAEA